MSESIPESIPTSADPRSKRPLKRARGADTPASAQAATLSALFNKPDQVIHIPSGQPNSSSTHTPEIVANVQGSSAGAGSGEFHVYKASRRREYERLRAMDEEVKNEEDLVVFERERKEREERDAEKTRKNREKREKLKARKGKKGGGAIAGGVDGKAAGETKVPKVQARADGTRGVEEEHTTGGEPTAEPQGLIIHDDD